MFPVESSDVIVADEVPVPEPVQSPQERLTKFFERRPSQHELEERNILKDAKIAPALQSAKAELEKARLEDDLAKKIAQRPNPEELIKEHILEGMALFHVSDLCLGWLLLRCLFAGVFVDLWVCSVL